MIIFSYIKKYWKSLIVIAVILYLSVMKQPSNEKLVLFEGIDKVVPLSVFRCRHFDERYGITMTDGPLKGLLARAVVIVDETGKIIYEELVPEITHEPDYGTALKVLR